MTTTNNRGLEPATTAATVRVYVTRYTVEDCHDGEIDAPTDSLTYTADLASLWEDDQTPAQAFHAWLSDQITYSAATGPMEWSSSEPRPGDWLSVNLADDGDYRGPREYVDISIHAPLLWLYAILDAWNA